MYLSDIQAIYKKDQRIAEIAQALQVTGAKAQLRGMVGAAHAFVQSAIAEQVRGMHVVILSDKEAAAYFLNDLENSLGLVKTEDPADVPSTERPRTSIPDKPINVHFFPRSARVAYELEETDNANVALRTAVLSDLEWAMKQGGTKIQIVVTYPEALCEKVVTQKVLEGATFEIAQGNQLDLDFVDEWMHTYHFEKVDYVYAPGQYAIRGGILDIFSYSYEYPYRIELFCNEVDSIRKFEAESQLSVAKMTKANIVPDVNKFGASDPRVSLLQFPHVETIVWNKESDFVFS